MSKKRTHEEALEETHAPNKLSKPLLASSQPKAIPIKPQLLSEGQYTPREHDRSSDRARDTENGDNALSQALNFAPTSNKVSQIQRLSNSTKVLPPYTGHPSTLPPLPPILSESLSLVPFTHPGYLGGSNSSKLHSNYDRLEFLGDAYIEVIATRLVFTHFPNLPAGRLSQHREMCVKNETLAEYALAYGFDKRARIPFNIDKADRKIFIKTMGDIFEAYVAAIIMSNPESGFQTAEAWLTALWQNKLSPRQPKPGFETQTVDPDAKTSLAKKVLSKGIKLEYKEEAPPKQIRNQGKIVFHMGVYLTGWGWQNQHLGSGSGLSKSEAGAVAAIEALKNPLTEQVNAIKKEFDANVAAERAKREEGEA